MAVLDSISGSVLTDTMPFAPGSNDPFGGMVSASVVDQNNTALGNQSIGSRLKRDLEAILTAGGYDITALTANEKAEAQLALNWACIHEFTRQGWVSMPFGQKDNKMREEMEGKLKDIKQTVCQHLHNLSLTWPQFCATGWTLSTVTLSKHCENG